MTDTLTYRLHLLGATFHGQEIELDGKRFRRWRAATLARHLRTKEAMMRGLGNMPVHPARETKAEKSATDTQSELVDW